jgi:nucleotide-binding universal stress UspA family protein
MAISTILVHMSNDERHGLRLQVAVELARKFNAFLEIVQLGSAPAEAAPATGRAASMALAEEEAGLFRRQAQAIEHEVRRACREVSYSWTVLEGEPLEHLAYLAGCADLVLIGQADADRTDDRALDELPERLPTQVPCPVLILPRQGPVATPPGQHVLVAWKDCREAGRALRDALPILQAADRVTVLTVGRVLTQPAEVNDILVFLERHGVEAEFLPDDADDAEAGEAILRRALERECDLIVMGGYSHSRLRDLVLGSATNTVLNHMPVPVLMAY